MRRFLWISILFISSSLFCISQDSPFNEFLSRLRGTTDSLSRAKIITSFVALNPEPMVEDSIIHFYYSGPGNVVSVPGEFNSWNPSEGQMKHVEGTDFFFRDEHLSPEGRVEYKIWVDSAWNLDPANPRRSAGPWGGNSEVRMPRYQSGDIAADSMALHGKLDTLWFDSYSLSVRHPVFVYTPPGLDSGIKLPSIYVTDGSDYINLGKMTLILDKLIAAKRISPVIGIFIEPRTVLENPTTNQRMKEYAADNDYLDFLEKEVAPAVEAKYPLSIKPSTRLIVGASMGGLIATYAVLKRPAFISNCAAQSPSYWQADSAVVKLVDTVANAPVKIYMTTGTIHDTEEEARIVRDKLRSKGFQINYAEYPEGHNWTNWQARIPVILEYFFPKN